MSLIVVLWQKHILDRLGFGNHWASDLQWSSQNCSGRGTG